MNKPTDLRAPYRILDVTALLNSVLPNPGSQEQDTLAPFLSSREIEIFRAHMTEIRARVVRCIDAHSQTQENQS